MKQFAVIGLGRFGSSVARTLEALGHQVMGIDRDHARVNQMRHELTHVVEADCTDEDQIRALGLRNFDAVVMAVGGDLEESVLITLLLKEAGVPRVVAKASGDLHGKLLEKIGADQVIYPERDMGVRVAHHILTGIALDSIELSPGYRVIEVPASPAMYGRSLRDLNLRARFRINVMAIRRGEEVVVNPTADEVIFEGDVLVVAGEPVCLSRLQELEEPSGGG